MYTEIFSPLINVLDIKKKEKKRERTKNKTKQKKNREAFAWQICG